MKLCFVNMMVLFKHPTGNACLYFGERGERVGPPGLLPPAFSIAYGSATTGQILFKFSTCAVALGNFF